MDKIQEDTTYSFPPLPSTPPPAGSGESFLPEEQPAGKLREKNTAFVETGLIILGLLAIFILLPRDSGGDGYQRFLALWQILTRHSMPTLKLSLIGPIFALPLTFIGWKLSGHTYSGAYTWTIVYNQVIFAATLLVGYLFLRKHMNRSLLRKFYLLLITGSMFVAHLAFFYGEVFTALGVGFGLLLVFVSQKGKFGWGAVILGVANTPAALGGLALVLGKQIWDRRRLRYVSILVATLALVFGEAWLRRGSPFATGYSDDYGYVTFMPYSGLPGFSYPFFFGVISLLFSFGKGLLWFTPGLLLPIRKSLQRWHSRDGQSPLWQVTILWYLFVIGLIVVYARWWSWYGGAYWGPRFLLFASLPASLALAVRLHHPKDASLKLNLLTLVILLLSVWVCIDGAVYQWTNGITLPGVCSNNNYALEMACYYIPEFSALWYPFVIHKLPDTNGWIWIAYELLVFVYLAIPLFAQIASQSKQGWQSWKEHQGNVWLKIRNWSL